MTYIPAETDPQRGRRASAPPSGAESAQSQRTQVIPAVEAPGQQPHPAQRQPSAWAEQSPHSSSRGGSHPVSYRHPGALQAPASALQQDRRPLRADARPEYPGQSVYHYGGDRPRERRRDLSAGIVLGQLVRAALLFALAAVIAWGALRTVNGQWTDEIALQQAGAVSDRLPSAVTDLLSSATLITCAAAVVISLILAASNRRWIPLLVAAATAVPALVSVQALKHGVLAKTAYGIQESAQNSLPSGHTAAAAAAVAVVVMVSPASQRKLWALLGTVAVTLAGVGTVINGWHRPADAVVAVLVVAGWFVLGSLLLRALIPAEPWVPQRGLTLALLTIAAAVLCALALTAQQTVPAPGLALSFGALAVLTISLFAAHQLVRAMRPRRR